VLWVLCLDEQTIDILTRLQLEHVRLVDVRELEAADPELAATKFGRLPVEYYWTCGPAFLLYVLNQDRDAAALYYLDADTYCFSDPTPLEEELDGHSILLAPHGGAARVSDDTRRVGNFNVGLIGFRRTSDAVGCLERWRAQCIEWCFDRFEDGKFGDQAYLDEWPDRVRDTAFLRHEGAGVAPWNAIDKKLSLEGARVMVGTRPLMFYHFGRVRRLNYWLYELHDWRFHRYKIDTVLRKHVYLPYVRQLQDVERNIRRVGGRLYPGHLRYGTENDAARRKLAATTPLPLWHRLHRFLFVTRRFAI